jgi:hypothetical protein
VAILGTIFFAALCDAFAASATPSSTPVLDEDK